MKYKGLLCLVLFLITLSDIIEARRFGGGGGSRSGSRSSWGISRSSSRPSSTSHASSSSSSSGSRFGGIFGRSSPPASDHRVSIPSISTMNINRKNQNPGHSSGPPVRQYNKDASTSFLHAEGGGATRQDIKPVSTIPKSNPYNPSAPLPSHSSFNVPSAPRTPYQPSAPLPSHSSSNVPSAPPINRPPYPVHDNVPKASVPLQNAGNPAWSNPHYGTNHPSTDWNKPSNNNPIGFKPELHPRNNPSPPYPVNHPMGPPPPYSPSNHPMPHPPSYSSNIHPPPYSSINNPTMSHPPPYPGISHSSPYHPTNGAPPPYSYNPPPAYGHAQGSPFPPYTHHNPSPAYQQPYGGSPHIAPSYPQQPAAQPYVPGQTMVILPSQQYSGGGGGGGGRGLGDMVKEALVFSTVNAGVNRLLNPYPTYHHNHNDYVSRPIPSSTDTSSSNISHTSSTSTTNITYNNQYFNTNPGSNNTSSSPTGEGTLTNNGGTNTYPGNVMSPSSTGGTGGTFIPPAYNPSASNVANPGSPAPGNPSASNVANPGSPAPGNPSVVTPVETRMNTNENQSSENPGNSGSTIGNNNVAPIMQYKISEDELLQLTEELFTKQEIDFSKYISLNLQKRSTNSTNITDEAKEPLFNIKPEVYELPTIQATRALYDNYENDSRVKETHNLEKRKEENMFLDVMLNTDIMTTTMNWLANHGFIDPDDFERKEVLRQMWFKIFQGSTSGFERIFTSEIYGGTDILGVQDWIYFDHLESSKRVDYMGYVDQIKFGDRASLLKLNLQMNGIIRPNATVFVGTSPELELSLYTICFYARPNDLCPVSLGKTKFHIFTHYFRYYGKDLIDLAVPMF